MNAYIIFLRSLTRDLVCAEEGKAMLTLLFLVLIFAIFGKLLVFAVKATWGITRIIVTIVLFPLILVAMVFAGLFTLVLPILIIVGLISMFALKI